MIVLRHRDSANDLKYLFFLELSQIFLKIVSTTAHFFASNHRYKSTPNRLTLLRNIFFKKRGKTLINNRSSFDIAKQQQQVPIDEEKLRTLCLQHNIWNHFGVARKEFLAFSEVKQMQLLRKFYFDLMPTLST